MTRYLIQETVTSQAVAALMKNPHDRTEAVRPVFESGWRQVRALLRRN